MQRRNFVTPRLPLLVCLLERRVAGAVEGDMILGLFRKHVNQQQFDVRLGPLLCVKCVGPDVCQLMQGSVVVFGAKRDNLVVKVGLAKFVVVLSPPPPRWDVVVEIQFLKLNVLLLGYNMNKANNRQPPRALALVHSFRKIYLEVEVRVLVHEVMPLSLVRPKPSALPYYALGRFRL